MKKHKPDYAKINEIEADLGMDQTDYSEYGVPLRAPWPKFGWSEQVAKEHAVVEDHSPWIPTPDELHLSSEWVLSDDNQERWRDHYPVHDVLSRHVGGGDCDSYTVTIMGPDGNPVEGAGRHSEWVARAMQSLEEHPGARRAIPSAFAVPSAFDIGSNGFIEHNPSRTIYVD